MRLYSLNSQELTVVAGREVLVGTPPPPSPAEAHEGKARSTQTRASNFSGIAILQRSLSQRPGRPFRYARRKAACL